MIRRNELELHAENKVGTSQLFLENYKIFKTASLKNRFYKKMHKDLCTFFVNVSNLANLALPYAF